MPIPKDFVERGLEMSKGALCFGEPIESLTKDELIALVAHEHHQANRRRDEHKRQNDLMLSLARAKRGF